MTVCSKAGCERAGKYRVLLQLRACAKSAPLGIMLPDLQACAEHAPEAVADLLEVSTTAGWPLLVDACLHEGIARPKRRLTTALLVPIQGAKTT